ncbi:MAG: hydroxysqualene dehydroxylase HpnE [Alphaproteobacteria bacterium]|nr:hydroxysqualene dehydroxylase HpnE [Alphaproteobacteria bacterium]
MPVGTIHIIGAGLAGLSAAVHLTASGHKVVLYEAGQHGGGRCRSYHDKELDCLIDNGNHLMLSCNEAALSYLMMIGAEDTLQIASAPIFPFMDIQSGKCWTIRMGQGRFPGWVFDKNARVPDTKWSDYLAALKLTSADRWAHVADCVDKNSVLYQRFWQPLCVAIMNTQAHEASAQVFGNVLREAFGAGGIGCKPVIVKEGLSQSFVDPAERYLKERGVAIHYGKRLRSLEMEADEIKTLHFVDQDVGLEHLDWVVLALPAWVINDLLPTIPTPIHFRSIVNAHFKVSVASKSETGILGLIGGDVEWIFEKPNMISTTTSAAEKIVDKSAEEIAALLWGDIAKVYGLNVQEIPPYRIVKEKRATFAATPEEIIRRPAIAARNTNLVVCGDWTNTGLPSTIEGAIRSGRSAAEQIIPPQNLAKI